MGKPKTEKTITKNQESYTMLKVTFTLTISVVRVAAVHRGLCQEKKLNYLDVPERPDLVVVETFLHIS